MTIQQQWNEHQHTPSTSEECLDRAIEMAVERAIFGGNEMARRRFFQLVGASSAATLIRRVVPPPEMVANLKAGNVDGYLAPDPFNQRAVYENAGFIFMLSKDIWAGHPCCAFAISHEFAKTYPNTFLALFKAIVDATHFASKAENRKAIAEAIALKNYLNQPVTVLEQVLTGKYADGLGNIKEVPDRINFDPFPWHSSTSAHAGGHDRHGRIHPPAQPYSAFSDAWLPRPGDT